MKKALIVTIQNNHNFGNRLQNYALQKTLENLGLEVHNLSVNPVGIPASTKAKNLLKKFLGRVGMKKYAATATVWERRAKISGFTQEWIHNVTVIPRAKIESHDFSEFDVAVAGSDQVWHNWKHMDNELPYYYMQFIDRSKRICYAPSFGFKAFPEADREMHKQFLSEMRTLSCREQEGCDLIRELTGREAQKVLDPTLLLSPEEWTEVERKPDFPIPEKYMFKFFLGKESEEFRAETERIAGSAGLTVIDINDKSAHAHYAISPSEFIWLIHHADTVCTDSFHATVFSVLYSRNARVFQRISPEFGNMFGRLHDLLSPLGLLRVAYGIGDGSDLSTKLSEEAAAGLAAEREQSIRYLRESIELCGEQA